MSIEKSPAISLGMHKMGDTSAIATLLSRDFGLIKCVAKGIRSKKNKYGNALEPFMLSNVVFYYRPKKDLFTLSQADVTHFYPRTHADLAKTAYANVSVDLLKHVLLPAGHESRTFAITQEFLDGLETAEKESECAFLLVRFLLLLNTELGFQINTQGCESCGSRSLPMRFDQRKGCVYCAECMHDKRYAALSNEVYGLMSTALSSSHPPSYSNKGFLDTLHLLLNYLSLHLDRPLRLPSLEFLHRVCFQ